MSNAISQQPDLVWVVPGRLLATVVDYLVISAFASLIARLGFSFDTLFVATFLLGAAYFGFGNSRWSNGQTLGKRAFGVQVLDRQGLLPFWKSILRYVLSIGIIILVVEVPQLIFRKNGTVASLSLLESPMLIALNILAVQFACIVTSYGTQGLHDFILRTKVVRSGSSSMAQLSRTTLAFAFAFSTIASILWFGQIQLPPIARNIYQHRFLLERDVSIRILQVVEDDTRINIRAVALTESLDYDSVADQVAEQVEQTLRVMGGIDGASLKKLLLSLQFEHGDTAIERTLFSGRV